MACNQDVASGAFHWTGNQEEGEILEAGGASPRPATPRLAAPVPSSPNAACSRQRPLRRSVLPEDSVTHMGSAADVAAAVEDPLMHYLLVGAFRGGNPHTLFDSTFYLERNADVASRHINPLFHYLQTGWCEGRNPHPLFDSAFYLRENADVAAAKTNPLVHFTSAGGHEGRNPNPFFDTSFYLTVIRPCANQARTHSCITSGLAPRKSGRPVRCSTRARIYARTRMWSPPESIRWSTL